MSFGPSKKHFTLQLKCPNDQSVGGSNGFEKEMIRHVRELQTQNNKRQKCHFKKPLIKNRSTTRYTDCERKDRPSQCLQSFNYDTVIEDENRFSLLYQEGFEDGYIETISSGTCSSEGACNDFDLSIIANLKTKQKKEIT